MRISLLGFGLTCCLSIATPVLAQETPNAPATTAAIRRTFDGYWRGVLKVGQNNLTLVFEIRSAPDGTLNGWVHSIDQGAIGLKAEKVKHENGTFSFEMPTIGATFNGKLNEQGQLIGAWKQGADFPVTLAHVETVPELERPQDPKPPLPYTATEVRFASSEPGIELSGTLTHPNGEGPFPAVVFVQDSAPNEIANRDSQQWGHRPLLVLADALTRRGIATLRFDARHNSPEALTYQSRAADVLAACKYLQARPDVQKTKTGLLGWSGGGAVASLVASNEPTVAFLVLMATAGVSGQDLMSQQVLSMPEIKDQAIRQIEIMADLVDILETEDDTTEREKKVRAFLEAEGRKQFQIKDDVKDAARLQMMNHLVDTQTKLFSSPYFRSFIRHDPRQTLAKVRCPVLAITGERSIYAPPKENLGAIQEALQAGGNKDFTVQELPNLNHQFQTSQGGGIFEAGKIKETIVPSVLQLVGDWLEKQTAK